MQQLIGEDAQLDPRRFRPNILIESETDNMGFVEDSWLDSTLTIAGNVNLSQIKPAFRCVMITHKQDELRQDMRILCTAVRQHQNNVGASVVVSKPGKIKVGDPIFLLDN